MLHKIATWNLALWCATLTIALTLEMLGIFKGGNDTTLTSLTCRVIPVYARAMILGWLCYHFLIQHQ